MHEGKQNRALISDFYLCHICSHWPNQGALLNLKPRNGEVHSAHHEFKATHRAQPSADEVGNYSPLVNAAGGRGGDRVGNEFFPNYNLAYCILNMWPLSHKGIKQSA